LSSQKLCLALFKKEMEQKNGQKAVAFNDEKQSPNVSTYETTTDRNLNTQQQFLAFQQSQQIPSSYSALHGSPVTQMQAYPPRYYYQYYLPHAAALPPSAFTSCGIYPNAPSSDGNVTLILRYFFSLVNV
jgi:hypothetical protein